MKETFNDETETHFWSSCANSAQCKFRAMQFLRNPKCCKPNFSAMQFWRNAIIFFVHKPKFDVLCIKLQISPIKERRAKRNTNISLNISLKEEGSEEEEFIIAFSATGLSYDSTVEEAAPKELQHGPVLNRALFQVIFSLSTKKNSRRPKALGLSVRNF